MPEPQYTSEDIARWLHDHIEQRAAALSVERLERIWCRVKDKPPLQNRVDAFLHAVDNFAVPLAGCLDRTQHRRILYHIVKLWASTLVGWDAPKSEYVEHGFDVLMDYAIEQLKV